MKKIALIFVLLVPSIVFAQTPLPPTQSTTEVTTTVVTPTSTPGVTHDDDIVTAVYSQFEKDQALIGTKLTVSSQNAIVTIQGTVTAQSQADAAVISAKSVNGVKDVHSEIIVTTNPDLNKSANPNPTNY